MAVQVGFGIIYLVNGIGTGQQYPESLAFLALCPVPAFFYVFLQILAGICALWFFLGVLIPSLSKPVRGFLCAYFLTIPFLLQMQLSVLPYGFCLSALLWLLGETILLFREEKIGKARAFRIGGAYFLFGLFCTDGLWPGLAFLFVTALFLKKRGGKLRYAAVIFGVSLVLLLIEFVPLVKEAKKLDECHNSSLGTAMVTRFMWPDTIDDYWAWSIDIKYAQDITEADGARWRLRERELERTFYPRLVEKYGVRKTEKMLLETAYRELRARNRERLLDMWEDFRNISLLPFTLEKNLEGKGDSVTGRNYARFTAAAPTVAKLYLRYSFFVLPLLLLFCLLFFLSEGMKAAPETMRVVLFTAIAGAAWFTVRSNAPLDYKPLLFLLLFWHLPVASIFKHRESK